MIVAISGSHGAGKTTLIRALRKNRPAWDVRTELTRSLVPLLGYSSPYEIVDKHGIAMYEAIILGQWSVLHDLTPDNNSVILLDRSPVDNLGYYFLHKASSETVHEDLLVGLVKTYLNKIDMHLHVPLLPFSVELDSMQLPQTQVALQDIIRSLYKTLDVAAITLSSIGIDDRCFEATKYIETALEKSRRTLHNGAN